MLKIANEWDFSPAKTFDCGQCFRFLPDCDGIYHGIAYGKKLDIGEDGDSLVVSCTGEEFDSLWRKYLSLDDNYSCVGELVSGNSFIENAYEFGRGIRILKQEPWEALCSFILSQRCNIPRIRRMVSILCENFGEETDGGYTFPSAEKVASLTYEELDIVKAGYRADYIKKAAEAVACGKIDLNKCAEMPTESAREKLLELRGVGKKVADCVLLYGLGHNDAFPVDVWMERALLRCGGTEYKNFGDYAGIIQQYMFYYIINNKDRAE